MSGERTGRSVRNRRISRKQKACRRVVHMQSPGAALARPLSGGSPSIRAGGQTAKSPRHRIGRRPPQGFRPSSRSNRHRKAHPRSRPAVRRKTSRRGSSRSRRSTSRPRECRRQRRPPETLRGPIPSAGRQAANTVRTRTRSSAAEQKNFDKNVRPIRRSTPSHRPRPCASSVRTVPTHAAAIRCIRVVAPSGKGTKQRLRDKPPLLSGSAYSEKIPRKRGRGGVKRGCPKRIRQPLSESGFRSFLRGPTSFLQPQIVTRERERTADQCAQEIEYLGRHPAP